MPGHSHWNQVSKLSKITANDERSLRSKGLQDNDGRQRPAHQEAITEREQVAKLELGRRWDDFRWGIRKQLDRWMLLADEVFEHDGFQDSALRVGVP